MASYIQLRRFLASTALLFLCVACGGDKRTDPALTDSDSLLRFVPADTPFAFASIEPLPDDFLDKIEPQIEKLLGAYRALLRETYRETIASAAEELDQAQQQRYEAIASEVISLVSLDGLHGAGITRKSQIVLFSNGLLPVLRIALSDVAQFENAIDRIEKASGEEMDRGEIDGKGYRYIEDDEARMVIAVLDGSAVFAIHPLELGEPQLRQLLGLTLPDKSIAATTILSDLAKKYSYTGHYIGFFDSRNFAATLLEGTDSLSSTVLAGSGFDSRAVSDLCKQEIRQLADIAPRVVFGYEEINGDLVSGKVVVELRDDLTTALQTVAAVVPGLGIEQGGLLSVGLSANLPKWREFLSARLDALQKDPYQCEYFDGIQEGADQARAWLNQPLPPVAYGIRGFNAVLESLSKFDFANPQAPKQLDGSLVLAVDDAPSLVAMGALFSGELANLDLKPNGVAVELKLQQLEGVAVGTFVALQDDALALAFGEGADVRAGKALKAKTASPPPVFSMSMDSKGYYEFVASNLDGAPVNDVAEGKPMSPEAINATRDMLRILGETYERVTTDARFTERGLEIRSRVLLADF